MTVTPNKFKSSAFVLFTSTQHSNHTLELNLTCNSELSLLCVTMFDIFRNKFRPSSFVINMQIFRPGYQAIVQMTNKIIFQVFPTTAIHYNTTGNSVCWDFSEFF